MKRELYQFYPEVYPFNLWIYVGKDVSGMVECFFETVCHEASHVSTEAFNFLGEKVKKLRTILVSQWMDRKKVRGSKDRNSRR